MGKLSTLEAANNELQQRNTHLEVMVKDQTAQLQAQKDTITRQAQQLQTQVGFLLSGTAFHMHKKGAWLFLCVHVCCWLLLQRLHACHSPHTDAQLLTTGVFVLLVAFHWCCLAPVPSTHPTNQTPNRPCSSAARPSSCTPK